MPVLKDANNISLTGIDALNPLSLGVVIDEDTVPGEKDQLHTVKVVTTNANLI